MHLGEEELARVDARARHTRRLSYSTAGRCPTACADIRQRHAIRRPLTWPPCTIRSTGNYSPFPTWCCDLLRAVGDDDWIADVDLDTLEKLPADHVGDSGQTRRGDAAWRVRFRNGWLYLLVVLEFQSTNDPRMALRNLEYTALLYRELDRRKELGRPGRWPPVLPVVLYNGDTPWTAALEMRDLIADVPAVLSSCQPSQRTLDASP